MNEYLTKKRSSGDYGKQETLPPSLQTKMNQSFGMDFSSVKVYRNDEMAGTGMKGLASGNRVILSKEINLNTLEGQAVLGHELSHIHAQSQGIGGGHSGLLNNAALERQADAEGLMAAHGQPIFGDRSGMNMGAGMGGMGTLRPLSEGLAPNAGTPMQAKGEKKWYNPFSWFGGSSKEAEPEPEDPLLDQTESWKTGPEDKTYPAWLQENKSNSNGIRLDANSFMNPNPCPECLKKYTEDGNKLITWDQDKAGSEKRCGPNISRMTRAVANALDGQMNEKQLTDLFAKVSSKKNEEVSEGAKIYKIACLKKLREMERKYGTLLTELDPTDLLGRIGQGSTKDFALSQDAVQLHMNVPEEFKESLSLGQEEDQEYKRLSSYYGLCGAYVMLVMEHFRDFNVNHKPESFSNPEDTMMIDFCRARCQNLQEGIGGPSMNEDMKQRYRNYLTRKKH